jgi:peptidoglycan/xylan/chitin deacetylase (PgdA/CDA1 family)
MRVGFWRLLEVLRHVGVTPTFALNGNVCKSYPRIAEAALDEGWEFMGHGFVQGPMHRLDDQRGAIRSSVSRSGETGSPKCSKSSPVLATTVNCRGARIRYNPSASLAPPIPPDKASTLPVFIETDPARVAAAEHRR